MRALTLFTLCSVLAACGGPDSTGDTEDAISKKKCHSNSDCKATQFCDTEGKASCSSTGVCTSRGINLFCSDLYQPICGCDGNTYGNSCLAHKAGTSVASTGACEVTCNTNADCGSLQYCSKKEGQCGAQGVCTSRGINLFCSNLCQPICGCDGNTYCNTCLAAKAGASLAHDGACTCSFQSTDVDGDTLAEQPWMDTAQNFFYTFTGNGTLTNDSGTVTSVYSPACLRTSPRCAIATRQKTGTFTTSGSTITISYDDGSSATFDAQTDCNNTWQLVGSDWGGSLTLVVSTLNPTP